MEPKIKLENISKVFHMYNKQSDKLLEIFTPKRKRIKKSFLALNNISFEVYKGETIGVIGTNGSGKSTLSNLLAGVNPPTSGNMEVNGEVSLIAINAGLKKELTGLENIELKCLMLGLNKKEIERIKPQIIEFAEIGDFVYQPVKNYSSGMKSRLGFAISTHINPDILIIDEALSVGDKTFYKKCLEKIAEFKAEEKTIFFISHSTAQIRSISDRVLWLDGGEIKEFGDAAEVINHYNAYVKWFNKLSKVEKKQYKHEIDKRRSIVDKDLRMIDQTGSRRQIRNNKRNIGFFLQISILFLITVISAFFMFMDESPLAYYNRLLDDNEDRRMQEEGKNDSEVEVKEINHIGTIISPNAKLFSDVEMEEKITVMNFATGVEVLEKIEDAYKVEYKGQEGFVKTENVSLEEYEPVITDYTIYDLKQVISPLLETSYEFFLAYLGVDYNIVKAELGGLTEEGEINGFQFLKYGYDDLVFTFNSDKTSDRMIIENINVDDYLIDKLYSEASLVSKDESMFYVALSEYDLVVDIENHVMEIKLRLE
ncbi:teichoic acids export ABC transporter ATP-binding subunit TagH [Oceanobacillus sp. J11TS1]|uniref:teichoic acids export ABC transporter ATP-binding subunit TagH n=1 Tax=Oceanobacillus sp. J11TS1 TaxID=2807191 RepID=UPI001B2A0003|nr:teichoic acids export ABC transporter ATP-binding subunit TagH [Oceanobacillus sp. J11TS1]GIO23434.1 teichoic acids export ATP-binding protein TagH [Oceanobacillus sp. J11TS1]